MGSLMDLALFATIVIIYGNILRKLLTTGKKSPNSSINIICTALFKIVKKGFGALVIFVAGLLFLCGCGISIVLLTLLIIYLYATLTTSQFAIACFSFIIFYAWDKNISSKGGRRINSLRQSFIWKLYADYFPVKLIKTFELDASKTYLFGYHPHGVISVGAFASFATEGMYV